MVDVAQLVEPRIVIPAVVGSSPIVHPNLHGDSDRCHRQRSTELLLGTQPVPEFFRDGLLAQLVEQLTLNQLVIGSSPIRPTTLHLVAAPRQSE